MKKVISVVISLVLVFCLTATAFAAEAASPSAEAYALIAAAEKKMEGKSLDLAGNMKGSMVVGTESADIATSMRMLLLPKADGEVDMYIEQRSDIVPTIKQYYKDGWLFSDVAGVKTRQRSSIAEMEALLKQSGFDDETLTQEMFKDATVEETESGKQIKLVVPGELMNDLTGSLIQGMVGAEMELDIGDVTMVYTISEDGVIKSIRQLYDVAMSVEGIDIAASYDTNMRYVSVGVFGSIPQPGNMFDYALSPAAPTVDL
jgi:hypothetical protein